jgi:hypothetical protein
MSFNWLVFGFNRVVYKDAEDGKWTGDTLANHLNNIEGEMTILWIVESSFEPFDLIVITDTLWYFMINQKRSVRSILGGLLRAVPTKVYELGRRRVSVVELSDGRYMTVKQSLSGCGVYLKTADITKRLDTQASSLIGFIEYNGVVLLAPDGQIIVRRITDQYEAIMDFDNIAVFANGEGWIIGGEYIVRFTLGRMVYYSSIRVPHDRQGEIPLFINEEYLVYIDAVYSISASGVDLCPELPRNIVECQSMGVLCDNGLIYLRAKVLNKTPCLLPIRKCRKSARY